MVTYGVGINSRAKLPTLGVKEGYRTTI